MKLMRMTGLWLWMGVIFLLSSIPQKDLPDVHFFMHDKLVHLIIYSILGFFAAWRFVKPGVERNVVKSGFRLAFFVGVSYGFLDEFHQLFVPGRSFDMWDWLFDMFGILAGIILFKYLRGKSFFPVHEP